MTRFARRATTAAVLLAASFGLAVATASAASASTGTASATSAGRSAATAPYASLEREIVALTNEQRLANGCGALRTDARLTAAARTHSTDMAAQDFFSHTGSDASTFVARVSRTGYGESASGENIAWGYSSAAEVVTAWMNSPGHRANILNCASVAVGVGVARKADGTPYWTQDFGRI